MMIMYRSAPMIERTATEPKTIPAIAPLEKLEDESAAAIGLGIVSVGVTAAVVVLSSLFKSFSSVYSSDY
jgi:hypothetical protein